VAEEGGDKDGGMIDKNARWAGENCGNMYLALERNERLFIIGVYAEKEKASEACRKY